MSESSNKPADLYDSDTTDTLSHSLNKSGKCEVPNEFMNYRDIMLKNQFDLKKKEEEVQEYAKKLTKIKSKVKSSRHSVESSSKLDESDDSILDISDPKTPSEKGLLLKKKLEENRIIFELRNKELNESQRAAEVKVEKILQQLNDSTTASNSSQLVNKLDDRDKKIYELNNKIIELESTIIDLKDNLSNKDSVIESKTKAITLVSDTLSQKSKVTLDKLEDTKDEMRNMQENFIKIESDMKIKVDNLLSQIQSRDSSLSACEDKIKHITSENNEIKLKINDKDKRISELEEKLKVDDDLNNLINEKDNQIVKLQHDIQELNHNMIKIKAQNKSKLKNLQKRLDSYYKASGSNDEGVNFVNQVAILEEEIGNLQLNLVDFDEIKATNEDLKKHISELNDQLVSKSQEVDSYNNAIVTLENQKLELIQELHEVKQEVLALESENADCENQRVTAELKVVELEEKLELIYKQDYNKDTIYDATKENTELFIDNKSAKYIDNITIVEKLDFEGDDDLEKLHELIKMLNENYSLLYKRLNIEQAFMENLVKSWDVDTKNIDRSKIILTELIDKLIKDGDSELKSYLDSKEKDETDERLSIEEINIHTDILDDSVDVSKSVTTESRNNSSMGRDNRLLINELNNIINSLHVTTAERRKSLMSILNENKILAVSRDEKLTIISELNNQLNIINNKIRDKNQLIDSILQEKNTTESDNIYQENTVKINKLSKEVDNLKQNITEYEKKISLLVGAKDVLENQVEVCDEKLKFNDDLQRQVQSLTREIEQKDEQIETIMKDKPVLESELKEKSRINQNHLLRIDELTAEIADARQQLVDIERNYTLIEGDKKVLEDEFKLSEKIIKSVDELQYQIEQLNIEVENKKEIIESISNEKTALENELREKSQLTEENILKINNLSSEITDLQDKLAEHERNFILILNDKETLQSEIRVKEDERFKSIEELHDENEKLSSQLIGQESVITSVTDEKEKLEIKLRENEVLNEDSVERINKLASEMTMMKQKIAEHELNFTVILSDKNILEDEIMKQRDEKLHILADLHNQNEKLRGEIENKNTMIESMSTDKDALDDQLNKKEKLNEESATRLSELSDEIKNLRQQIVEHERNLTQVLSDKEMLEDQAKTKDEELKSIKDLQNEIVQFNAVMEKKGSVIESILADKKILELQLQKIEETYNTSLSRIHDLECETKNFQQQTAEHKQNFSVVLSEKQILEEEIKNRDVKLGFMTELNDKVEQLTNAIVDKDHRIQLILNEKTMLENQLVERDQLNVNSTAQMNELTSEIAVLKEKIADYERNLTVALSDKLALVNQIEIRDVKLQSMNEVYNQNELLRNEIANKVGVIESIANEKTVLEGILKEKEKMSDDSMLKMKDLLSEMKMLQEKIVEYDENFASIVAVKISLENELRERDEKLQLMKDLYKQIDHMHNELESKETYIETIVYDRMKLETTLDEKRELIEYNELRVNELSNDRDFLNNKLLDYDNSLQFMTNEIQMLLTQIKMKDEQLNVMNELNIQIENLKTTIGDRENTIEMLSHSKNASDSQLNSEMQLNKDNLMKIDELTSEISSLQNKIVEYENKAALNAEEMFKLHKRDQDDKLNLINELNVKIDQLNHEIEIKQSMIETVLKDKEALENESTDKEQVNQANLLKINELLNEMEKLRLHISEQEQNLALILSDKKSLNDQMAQLSMTMDSISSEKSSLENALLEKEQSYQDSVLKFNELSNEMDILRNQIAEYKRNFTSVSTDKEILEDEIKLKNEQIKLIDDSNSQIIQLKNELMNKLGIIESISSEKNTLENTLQEKDEMYQSFILKNSELIDDMTILHQKISELNSTVASLLSVKAMLEGQITMKDEKIEEIVEMQSQIDQLSKEMENKEIIIESILKDKMALENTLEEKNRLNKDNAIKIEQLTREIAIVKGEMSQRERNITSLLSGMVILEQQLHQAQEDSVGNQEKLGIMEQLNIQLTGQVDYANKLKSEMENSQKKVEESRLKCMDSFREINKDLESVVANQGAKQDDDTLTEHQIQSVIDADWNKISQLESELEAVKKQNQNQIQKMRIIAANLKKKTAQCQEYEAVAKEFKEKWENEVSEKSTMITKLESLELELNDRDRKIAELDELSQKRESELDYLKEKIKILENEIKDRMVQFNIVNDKITVELENCKKEHLLDDNLKETYQRVLELGFQVREMELKNISDLNAIQMFKSHEDDLFDSSQLGEWQKGSINTNNFREIISKMAEKYIIIETLKLKNKKLMETVNSLSNENQSCNDQLQLSQSREQMIGDVQKQEIVETALVSATDEKIDENVEKLQLDEDESWGWNEQSADTTEFKMMPICTPETQMEIKIAELEDKLKELQDKKSVVDDELTVIQLKNKQLIKKLKEYKIQNYNLQQQVKLQSNSSKLSDLDFTIEEELKNQVSQLEKNLSQLKEDNEKIKIERDNMMSRIEILTATKDELARTMTAKNNELMLQIKNLGQSSNNYNTERSVLKNTNVSQDNDETECLKCKEKILDLEDNVSELSVKNDEMKAIADDYQVELTKKQKEIEDLKHEIGYSKLSFYNMLEESHSEKKVCLDNLNNAFEKTENVATDLQTALDKEKSENTELKDNYETLREAEKEMNAKIENLSAELQSKNAIIDDLNASIDNVDSLLRGESMRADKLELKCKKIEKQLDGKNLEWQKIVELNEQQENDRNLEIRSLQNQLENLTLELQEKNEELNQVNVNFINLKHSLEQEHRSTSDLQVKYEQITHELMLKSQEYNQQLTEREVKIENLEKYLQGTLELRHSKSEQMQNITVASEEQKLQASNEDLPKLHVVDLSMPQSVPENLSQVDTVQLDEENFEKSTKEQENYSKSYEDLHRKLVEVNEALTNVTELLNIRVQEVADLKQYIKKLEFDKMAVDNDNTELNSVNVKLSEKNVESTVKLDKLKEEMNEKTHTIMSLETKAGELQALHDSAIVELDSQTIEIKSLKEIINKNEILIGDLEASIADRDRQIFDLRAALTDGHNKIQELTVMISDLQNSAISSEKFNDQIMEIEQLEKTIEKMKDQNFIVDEYEKKLHDNAVALDELKTNLSMKYEEVEDLKFILNDNTYPAIIQELQNKIDNLYEEKQQLQSLLGENRDLSSQINKNTNTSVNDDQMKDPNASELDVALYMLHQRDVRCEELTHELLQLLEERDTLQLRLSNAIKINEELKKYTPSSSKVLPDDLDSGSSGETTGSPAVNKPIEATENMDILNEKLSQLHNVNYHRDIRLIDERESRHMQQMSVINKNALSPVSSGNDTKLIDANYTISRDVQSQSNVLLNWFWGKSTPKVTHM